MSKKDVNNATRVIAPGFSKNSTDFEKSVFNPGGVGTGDTIDETGHKQIMESLTPGEPEAVGSISGDLLGDASDGEKPFPTRPQEAQRYRAGALSRSDNEADKLGKVVKRRAASRALLG